MDITLERARPSDAAELIEFFRTVGGETDNLTFGADGLPVTAEAEAGYIESLQDSADNIMLIARCGGKLAGNASLNRLPRRMNHRGDFSVVVAKEYWNRGIGSQLLCAVLSFARENGFEIIDLQVRSDNLPAIHLYEKYGFKKICTYPSFFRIGKQYIDFDYMCLHL